MASRTSKGLKNSRVAILYYVVNLIVGFFSRKVFLDYLGSEVLGLNTTAQNILGFLNLAELGIGSAIACTLYKPLGDNDRKSIAEVVSLQGWMYRRIAYFVGGASLTAMFFFPLFFKSIELPLWYAYTSFGVFLYSSLLTYFVNYRQILLSASQQEYLITYNYSIVLLVKSIIQIFALMYLPYPYVCWLVLQVLCATAASLNLNRAIRKAFPDVKVDLSKGKILAKKYPFVIIKVKQLFFHKIAGFVLGQLSPLIIYAYTTLTMVAIYGNYMMIVTGLTMMCSTIFAGINAGVGSLVAEGNKEKVLSVFEELFSARFFLVCIICFCFIRLTPSFITLGIGSQYILPQSTLYVITAIMYLTLTRTIVESYIYAYGLFKDVWAPIIETILNVGLSILFGYYYGITGILSGVFISMVVIVFLWKPFFLFTYGLQESLWIYVKMYLQNLFAMIVSFIISSFLLSFIKLDPAENFLNFTIQAIASCIILAIVVYILLFICTQGMKDFTCRMGHIIKNKFTNK